VIHKARHYKASGKAAQKKWRRFAVLALITLVSAFLVQLILRQLFFFPLTITGDSMIPEIQSGDKRYFIYAKLSEPKLGDIVLVRAAQANLEYLCRLIASDGDKVKITDGSLSVNSKPLRTLNYRLNLKVDRAFHLDQLEIRPGYFFCMNDNAQNTNDSRLHGAFSRTQIVARVFQPALFF